MEMRDVELRSIRDGDNLGIVMVLPNGEERLVAWLLVPYRGDFRADVEVYDEFVKIYKKRLKRAYPKRF